MTRPSKITTVTFDGINTKIRVDPLWQYDYGQYLKFENVTLPDAYEVHFGVNPLDGKAKVSIGNSEGVWIPDEYLTMGVTIYAWLFLHTAEEDGETEIQVIIPVNRRSKSTSEEPTPEQQSAITTAIAALSNVRNRCDDAAYRADQDATAAAQAKADAEAARDAALTSATQAAQVASEMGFIHFYIDDNGDLIYQRTTNVTDVDFSLVEGDLILHVTNG